MQLKFNRNVKNKKKIKWQHETSLETRLTFAFIVSNFINTGGIVHTPRHTFLYDYKLYRIFASKMSMIIINQLITK